MERGAITASYGLPLREAVGILNRVLASKLVCVLRYKRHFYMAQGLHAEAIAQEFLQHANDEQLHADGAPNFSPERLTTRSVAQYSEGETLIEMIREDLIAERLVVQWYAEIARWFGEEDPTTRRMMEDLLAKEEHVDEFADLLADLDADPAAQGTG
jgi:bacterioferritin